jgi:glycosyltransferase involved in cell wall biosynthesis
LSLKSDLAKRRVSLRRLLLTIRASDVVIIHGFYLAWVPFIAGFCRLARTPFVITPHGSLTLRQQTISKAKKRAFDVLVGWSLRKHALGFMTGSVVERDELYMTYSGIKAAVGGVGTRINEFRPKNTELDAPTLISISRLAPKKRVDLMIGALAELKSRGLCARLIVAGEGGSAFVQGLHDLASRLGVSELITFTGQVAGDEKSRLFEQADIFLLPSDDENFGIGLAEALAHSVPCVASANVAAASFMRNEGGVVLNVPTPSSIADAVEVILATAPNVLRKQAHDIAASSFSWASIADQWVSQLRDHWLANQRTISVTAHAKE